MTLEMGLTCFAPAPANSVFLSHHSSSSHQPASSVFLSHHSSSSLQHQHSEQGQRDRYMLDQLNRSHGAEAGRGNQSPRFQHVAASGPQNPMHKFRLHATCFPTIDFKFHLPSTHGWAHYTSTVDRSARSLRSRDLVPPLSFLIASAGGGHGRLRPGSSPGRSVSCTAGSVQWRSHH